MTGEDTLQVQESMDESSYLSASTSTENISSAENVSFVENTSIGGIFSTNNTSTCSTEDASSLEGDNLPEPESVLCDPHYPFNFSSDTSGIELILSNQFLQHNESSNVVDHPPPPESSVIEPQILEPSSFQGNVNIIHNGYWGEFLHFPNV